MIIPEGYAQVNLIFGGSAVPLGAQTTYGIELGDPADSASVVAQQVLGIYSASDLKTVIPTNMNLTSILVKFGPNATGQSALISAGIVSTGGTPNDSPAVSILVHKNTSFGGRSGRGRSYFPGVVEAGANAGGGLTPTFIGQWQSRLDDFREGHATADIPMVLLHGSSPVIAEPLVINELQVDTRVATQRRRLRR